MSDVIGEVDIDGAARDGGEQCVGVLAADAVDELSVRLVPARAAAAARRALAAGSARRTRPRRRTTVTVRPTDARPQFHQ